MSYRLASPSSRTFRCSERIGVVLLVVGVLVGGSLVPGAGTVQAAPHAVRGSAAEAGEQLFHPARRDFVAGRLIRDLAPIDFDEDGILDVACVSFNLAGPGAVQLLRGNGVGGFVRVASFSTAGGATSIAVGDFNEDDHADLVVSGFLDDTLALHLGDGDGGFGFTTLPFPGAGPFQVLAVDIDDDTHLDLVVPASGSQSVYLFEGDGDGAFTPLPALAGGISPQNVACGDLDGDEIVDLAVADVEGQEVLIYIGAGDGGFTGPQNIQVGQAPVWIDIDDATPATDALLAVALRNDDLVRVYRWEREPAGPGARVDQLVEIATLAAGHNPQAVSLHRFVGDEPGVAIAAQSSNELVLYESLVAEPQFFTTQTDPTSVRIADWSGDEVDDIFLPGFNTESVSLFLGDGAGGVESAPFVEVTGGMAELEVVDFDGDPQPDLAVLRLVDRQVTVLRGITATEYEPIDVGAPFDQVPTGFAALDVDGDPLPDFAVGHATGSSVWILGSASGYALSTYTLAGSGPTAIVAGDFDDDGDEDLAATLFLTNTVSVVWSDGAGGFELPQVIPVGTGPIELVAGDWNAVGLDDLAVVNGNGASISVLVQDALHNFHAAPPLPVEVGAPRGIAAGHLYAGRNLDLVVTGSAGVEILSGDGTGAFTSVQRLETAAEYERVRVADVDLDGHADVVAADRLGDGVAIYPVRPASRARPLRPVNAYGADADPGELETADLDLDGRPDVAVVARTAGRVSLLLSGEGRLMPGVTGVGATPAGPDVADASAPGWPAPRIVASPNPFRSETRLILELDGSQAARAELKIYDTRGRLVAMPYSGAVTATELAIDWDGRDLRGVTVARGVYFYQFELHGAPAAGATRGAPSPATRGSILRGKIVRR